ncbi:DPP IV N-terminal domain-containing protein [Lentzea aerocolonigenes]|uniref:DPP IV N-terminal domain-containing protein n=1 Tax=Lentzea aerocolonigenes TaxID=68170 RepID=UPI0004C4331F|nr:DPP IV N-terminal domain-containing protein [Lentzea aerocolonigenes]MCP2245419.1 WD40-like Beta Propeller Repeat [Lentzea aerocolonigenes]
MELSRRELLTRTGQAAAVATAASTLTIGTAQAGTGVKLTQGTNISVSRSSDGRWLAIDLVTAIWVLPAAGGQARRLTDELQDATLPSFGPGNRIAFQSYRDGNYHLYVIGFDGGGLQQLTRGKYDHREPAFSPDGTKIAFVSDRGGSYGVHVLELATGAITQLTGAPDEAAAPQWSKDGKRIIFITGNAAVEVVSLDGKREKLVTAPAGAQLFGAAFGPGDQPSYTVMRPGQADLMLGSTAVVTGQDVFGFAPVWDGDSVLYTADGKIRLRANGSTKDIPFEVSVPVRKVERHRTRNLSGGPVKGIAGPVVSSDGKIAFRALNAIHLLSNGKVTKLTDGRYFDSDPDFSPDGTELVYASDRTGVAQLWVRDLKTGEDKQFAPSPGAQTTPRFSPDGTKVAYVDQDGQVWVADAAGRRQITPTLFQPGRPTWSADGTVVALAAVKPFSRRFREGTSQILSVDLDSGELKYTEPMPLRSIATRGDDGPVWSPDGKHIAFVVESVAWVVPVDAKGTFTGEPRQVTREVTDSLAWHGDDALVYLNNGRLRKSTLDGRTSTIRVNLNWAKPKAPEGKVVRVGAYWDGEAHELKRNVDIVVENGSVKEIRPQHGRADVDASGLTAIPGLIDAHNHWHLRGRQWGARQGNVWLAYGITTVRSPGDPVYQMVETREALAAGTLTGPRFYATGEAVDGSRVYYNFMRPTLSKAQLDLELRRAHELGYDMIKTYVRLPVELQRAAVQRSRVPLSSHYLYPAANLGMDGMEHVGATNRLGYSHTVTRQGKAYQDVVSLFTSSGMSMTPTLFHNRALFAEDKSLALDERTRVLFPPWEYERYLADANSGGGTSSAYVLRNWVEFALAVHRGGGLVICGTDAPLDAPATATHMNLRAMVKYGFTPREALITATRNPARWLGLPIGAIKPGAPADISFVSGDPLAEIKAAADVRKVMVGGRLHEIEDLLAPYRNQPALRSTVDALEPLPSAKNEHWWHEPEWSEHVCCDH